MLTRYNNIDQLVIQRETTKDPARIKEAIIDLFENFTQKQRDGDLLALL